MGLQPHMKGFGIGAAFVLLMGPASAWAADGDDVAEAAATSSDATTREQVLQVIEATRQTDPALAAEMERQLDSTDLDTLPPVEEGQGGQTDAALQGAAVGDLTAGDQQGAVGYDPRLIGPPVEGEGTMPGQDPRFQEVQGDPRMQELHQQLERGEMSEGQARDRMFEILRDHGIEPADGREWEQGEHQEGFERAYEQMSPEAREQMERMFEGEHPAMEREFGTFERMYESPEHGYEAQEHDMESMQREYEMQTMEREYEAPTVERETETAPREYETQEHEMDAPEHEYEMPEPGSEPDYPDSPPQP